MLIHKLSPQRFVLPCLPSNSFSSLSFHSCSPSQARRSVSRPGIQRFPRIHTFNRHVSSFRMPNKVSKPQAISSRFSSPGCRLWIILLHMSFGDRDGHFAEIRTAFVTSRLRLHVLLLKCRNNMKQLSQASNRGVRCCFPAVQLMHLVLAKSRASQLPRQSFSRWSHG